MFEPAGAFQSMLAQPVTQAIAWVEVRNEIVGYALVMPTTERHFAYMPDRIRAIQLGLLGVWVRPEHRGRGYGTDCLKRLGFVFDTVRADTFVLSAEERTVSLSQPNIPLTVIPRWAWQQPDRIAIRRMMDAKARAQASNRNCAGNPAAVLLVGSHG